MVLCRCPHGPLLSLQATQLHTRVLCHLLKWLIVLTACHGRLFSGVNMLLINICLSLLTLTSCAGWKS